MKLAIIIYFGVALLVFLLYLAWLLLARKVFDNLEDDTKEDIREILKNDFSTNSIIDLSIQTGLFWPIVVITLIIRLCTKRGD